MVLNTMTRLPGFSNDPVLHWGFSPTTPQAEQARKQETGVLTTADYLLLVLAIGVSWVA
jgi:hypothetical protein